MIPHPSRGRRSRWIVFLIVCGALPVTEARAQDVNEEAGRVIGRIIAVGTLLAADDFAASGRYESDESDATFHVLHLRGGHRFRKESRWQPFVGGGVGRLKLDQTLDIDASKLGDAGFVVEGIAVGGGARVNIAHGWFATGEAAVQYSTAVNDLDYADPNTAALYGPIFDGVYFNWEIKAFTSGGRIALGWEHRPEGRVATTVLATHTVLRTDPYDTEDPVQDFTIISDYQRLAAAFEIPLGGTIFGRPLRFDPGLRVTWLDDDLRQPLASGRFADLRLALLAIMPGKAWVPAVGLAVTLTRADAFDGWSIGLTLGS